MLLYLLSRVETAERTKRFAREVEKSAPRVAAAKRGVATKQASTVDLVKTAAVSIRAVPLGKLKEQAIKAYNWRAIERNKDNYACLTDSPEFLLRITNNYIRHELTEYDTICHRLFGQVGRQVAYELLRSKVERAIDEAYPDLARTLFVASPPEAPLATGVAVPMSDPSRPADG